MDKQLAVLIIHGMGSQRPGFAGRTILELSIELDRMGKDPGGIAWKEIFWADILIYRQMEYLDDARATNDLGGGPTKQLRDFVVTALGDAAAYQFVDAPSSTYEQIHDRVRGRIRQLAAELGGAQLPMVVLAHSLGSQIISSYIWDTQAGKETGAGPGSSDFERMDWLCGLVTFGSNLPLFTFAVEDPQAIRFPGEKLPDHIAEQSAWLNYFDKHDILGYPLKPLGESYDAVVDQDIEINVGGFITSKTPKSHTEYWTDSDFIDPVAGFLARFLP
jgi:hypothetical protein